MPEPPTPPQPPQRPLHTYRVGEPYSPTRRTWPEGSQYDYRAGAHQLRLFLGAPTTSEIRAVRRGQAAFALYVEADLLVLLYRFEAAIPWTDAPYSWHLLQRALPDQATLPEPLGQGEETRALLTTLLVDASTGILRAIRALTLSPSFTAALHLAIRQQAARPWPGDAAYDRQLQTLYRRYPSSDSLASAAQSRTLGGA